MTDGHVILAFDIETDGAFMTENSMIAVGLAAVEVKSGKLIRKERICFASLPGREPEPRCMNEFWKFRMDVYETLKAGSVQPTEACKKLVDILDQLDDQHELIIVSDNPAFDFAWINMYLSMFLKRLPLSYKTNGTYRMLYDTDSFSKAAIKGQFHEDCGGLFNSTVAEKLQIPMEKPSLHFPEEDALGIANFFRNVYLKNL